MRAQDELEEPPPPPPLAQGGDAEGMETIRVDTELVDLNVSVFRRGDALAAVGELGKQDFLVTENGRPEEISFFASASTPFDLVLLLDLSGSSAKKLNLIRKSAVEFVKAARPTDRIGIVTFAQATTVVSPPMLDRARLVGLIEKIEKPHDGTNFWDALSFVLKQGFGPVDASRRRAVVVMSDGVDNALPGIFGAGSSVEYEDLLETVKASDVIVIPIYLDTEREMIKERKATPEAYELARKQLEELAGESGSLLYKAAKMEDLEGVYQQVIRDLGTVYSIGYQPQNRRRDGSWRTVSVRLVNRPDLAARTRRGYYAR
ncbi:MAG TPA: VWA domain-containing protein [Pyrinomonadaceae bacterium]|nr:VWA domain-containing protein [Pyrinomonadaceae bacterium]